MVMAIIGSIMAWLMVSNVRFISGKDVDLKQKRSFAVLVTMLITMVLIMIDPYRILFAVFLAYVLHGPMLHLWQHRQLSQRRMQRRLKRQEEKQQSSQS